MALMNVNNVDKNNRGFSHYGLGKRNYKDAKIMENHIKELEVLTEKIIGKGISRLLLIDDDQNFCQLLQGYFVRLGFKFDYALTFETGLKKFEERKYQVALIDIVLPNGDGLDLLSLLKEKSADVKLIITTGYPSLENQVRAMALGACGFIEKPIKLDELTEKVLRCL